MSRIGAAALAALLATLLLCPRALADADPASDILLGENVFYPYSHQVPSRLQAELNGVVAAAHRAHFPLKVALIGSPVDLGAIPAFFAKPRQYAAFLDQEISFGGKPPLLVVMPNGYGTAGVSAAAATTAAALPKPAGASGPDLAEAAIAGVRRISVAAGHPPGNGNSAPAATSSGTGVALPLAILAAVCVLLTAVIIALRRRRALMAARRRPRVGPRRR